MDEITERSGGLIAFDVYWGGALGGAAETFDLVTKGVVDIGTTNFGGSPAAFPLFGFDYAFPFGPPDPTLVTKAMWQIWDEFPEFEQQLAASNQQVVAILPWDSYQMMSISPIKELADIKGKVVGLWGVFYSKWFEAIGATGVPERAPDRYLNLKMGVIDAAVWPVETFISFKTYEVAKYFIKVDHGAFATWTISINKDSFNKLTPELQRIILDVGMEASLEQGASVKTRRAEGLAKLKDLGTVFSELSSEDKAAWAEAIEDIPAGWAADMEALGYPGFDIARRWQEITTEMGHEWSREWAVK